PISNVWQMSGGPACATLTESSIAVASAAQWKYRDGRTLGNVILSCLLLTSSSSCVRTSGAKTPGPSGALTATDIRYTLTHGRPRSRSEGFVPSAAIFATFHN